MPFASKAIRQRARRRVAARVRAGEPCAFCGLPIDLTIPYPDPASFTVDHAIPSSLGGTDNYEQLRAAHNACNRARSNLPSGTVGTNSGALTGGGLPPSPPSRPSHGIGINLEPRKARAS